MEATLETPWQPIKTAPKDGTEVDLWIKCTYSLGIYARREVDCVYVKTCGEWGRFDEDNKFKPVTGTSGWGLDFIATHWMYRPAAPAKGGED